MATSRARTTALFARWRQDRDPVTRDELVEIHLEVAHHLAVRYSGGAESLDDLKQVAAIGLVKAVERFDPERGIAFSTFAVPTIVGELKRHFRDHGWSVHVGRATQELALRLRRARQELESTGRPATLSALAERLHVEDDRVLDALWASEGQYTLSSDSGLEDDEEADVTAPWLRTCDGGFGEVERHDMITRASAGLDARQKQVLKMYFGEDLAQTEIARRIGVSQMQVSRILKRAMDHLRITLPAQAAQ